MLPRLKYHNPAIPMTVSRTTNQTGPATFSIFFGKELPTQPPVNEAESLTSSPIQEQKQDSSLSPSETLPSEFIPVRHLEFSEDGRYKTRDGAFLKKAPVPSPSQSVIRIDMKHKSEEQILEEFMKITDGKEVHPTQGELDTLRELEEFRQRARKDSERSKAVREKWKREQEMLKQARGELAS
jgi:large subunit ribosomal protein MRP49